MKSIPKQLNNILKNSTVTIMRKIPESVLEGNALVSIGLNRIDTVDFYIVYHSSTLNRLVWPSLPVEIHQGYTVKGSNMRLVEYLNYDIPNKEDKLTLILRIDRVYNFDTLTHQSQANIFMPKKKKSFKDITEEYYRTEERTMQGNFGNYSYGITEAKRNL